MNRRNFLAFLLASAAGEALAQTVDLERLLWVPKPIITVPEMPWGTIGAINRATYAFWRNQQVPYDSLKSSNGNLPD